jgi:2-isopropylmalate synthase
MQAEAMVKLRVGERLVQVAADGNGPVSALDAAVRKALLRGLPGDGAGPPGRLQGAHHQLEGRRGRRRPVLIESSDGLQRWRTVGASTDVVEASWLALQDAYEYWILRWGQAGAPSS